LQQSSRVLQMKIFGKVMISLLLSLPSLVQAYELDDVWVLAGVKGSADESWQGWCDNKKADFTDYNLYNNCATFSPRLKPNDAFNDAFSDWMKSSTSKMIYRTASQLGLAPLVKSLATTTSFNVEFQPGMDDSVVRFVLHY